MPPFTRAAMANRQTHGRPRDGPRPGRSLQVAAMQPSSMSSSLPFPGLSTCVPERATQVQLGAPPGLEGGAADDATQLLRDSDTELLAEALRHRPLPGGLEEDATRREMLATAVLTCVEGLYRDRIAPTLAEIRARMSAGCFEPRDRREHKGWSPSELQAILGICARDPLRYATLPPAEGLPARVMLRHPPAWFQGWVDCHKAPEDGEFSPAVWAAISELARPAVLAAEDLPSIFSIASRIAIALQQHPCAPEVLRALSLGELTRVAHIALTPGPASILSYDPVDGHRVKASTPPPSPLQADATVAAGRLVEALRQRPLPDAVLAKGEDHLRQLRAELRGVVESIYRDGLRPALGEIQSRLRGIGWDFLELQSVPLLAASDSERYEFTDPAVGKPCSIHLRQPCGNAKQDCGSTAFTSHQSCANITEDPGQAFKPATTTDAIIHADAVDITDALTPPGGTPQKGRLPTIPEDTSLDEPLLGPVIEPQTRSDSRVVAALGPSGSTAKYLSRSGKVSAGSYATLPLADIALQTMFCGQAQAWITALAAASMCPAQHAAPAPQWSGTVPAPWAAFCSLPDPGRIYASV